MQKFMSNDEFTLAMFEAGTNYADISAFFGSDRRTGHRWQEAGPSNQVSRLMQLMCALGLTLDDVRVLIAEGIQKSRTAIPSKVADLSTQVEMVRSKRSWTARDIDGAAREQSPSPPVQGGARAAARGGKGASSEQGHRSTKRAPKARQPQAAALR